MDLQIIHWIKSNPLASLKELQQKLGINRVSAGKKLQKLIDDNVLKIVCIANLPIFGFNVNVVIFVKVQPGHSIRAVSRNLASRGNVHIVMIISGRFDIYLWAVFRDSTEMYAFLRDELGTIPGVMKYESMLNVHTPSSAFGVATEWEVIED